MPDNIHDDLDNQPTRRADTGDSASFELDTGVTFRGLIGQTLGGRFEIIEEVGRGGMGVVYRARDTRLDSEIAVKVLPEEVRADPQAVKDLLREVAISQKLTHPNIVRLHDLQETPEAAFLTMEFIDGPSLIKVLADNAGPLPVERVIELYGPFCEGLVYAHEQGVIHQDIKPHNVMLTARGLVKICDFGIASVLSETASRVTREGTAGTLVYMSPEQLRGKHIDRTVDIYAAGAMAYHLLTGHPPFYRGDVSLQIITEQPEPIDGIPDHVNTAIMKALAKEPGDRWQNAEEFGEAVSKKPEPKPKPVPRVEERPKPEPERIIPQQRKQKPVAANTLEPVPTKNPVSKPLIWGLVAILLIGGAWWGISQSQRSTKITRLQNRIESTIAGGSWSSAERLVRELEQLDEPTWEFTRRIKAGRTKESQRKAKLESERRQREAEQQKRRIAEKQRSIDAAIVGRNWFTAERLVNELASMGTYTGTYAERIRTGKAKDAADARIETERGERTQTNRLVEQRQAVVVAPTFRKPQYAPGQLVRTLTGHTNLVWSVAVSSDLVASGSSDRTVKVWHLSSGSLVRTIAGDGCWGAPISMSRDYVVSQGKSGTVKVWHLSTGSLVRTLTGHRRGLVSIAVGGDYIVSGGYDKIIKVWSLSTGSLVRTLTGHTNTVRSVFISGDVLVSANDDKTIKVWRLSTGSLVRTLTGHTREVFSVAVSGDYIISGGYDNTVRIWSLSTGQHIRTLTGHMSGVRSVAVSGDYIVSGSEDKTVRIWRLSNGQNIRTLTGHTGIVYSVSVSGDNIVSGSSDKTIKIWRAPW
jgi:serine/threonine protein kinase/WD40 repeat protein